MADQGTRTLSVTCWSCNLRYEPGQDGIQIISPEGFWECTDTAACMERRVRTLIMMKVALQRSWAALETPASTPDPQPRRTLLQRARKATRWKRQ